MLDDKAILSQLPHVLKETDFTVLGEKYQGKVRDSYTKGELRYLITTDRLSVFDKVVTSIPFKGEVLQSIAVKWFDISKDVIPNHIIDVPDPNVMVVKNCEILPFEVVVRGYLAGSAWRDYEKGKTISGISLPKGMKASQRLPQTILTPSTKAEQGKHDTPISEKEILESGIVKKEIWQQVRETALVLFALGEEVANKQGLILVDTKYEFGLYQGKLILADEIHTLDSTRYWEKKSYQACFEKGEPPEMLDKEPVRQMLLAQGFMGDGPVPDFSDEKRLEIAKHYIHSFERITGGNFSAEPGSVYDRIKAKLDIINRK